jgi:hypothetical protein
MVSRQHLRLAPALRAAEAKSETIIIELDGTAGYGASFLEEVFGGLVRKGAFRRDQLHKTMQILARTDLFRPYKTLADRYIEKAHYETA